VAEAELPQCTALLISSDEAWATDRLMRLRDAENRVRQKAPGFVLDFVAISEPAAALDYALVDGSLQCVVIDASGLDFVALIADLKKRRAEIDVFVAAAHDQPASRVRAELFDREDTRADTLLRRLRGAISRRARTPFADTLRSYVEGARDAWHTPGHSSGDGLRDSPWVADFYRLMGEHVFNADLSVSVRELDSLLEPSHVIQSAQDLAAEAFGARHTFFVTGGTSMANKVIVQHLLGNGGKMLVDQGCHKSIHHAALLFGANPVYLPAAVNREFGLYGPVPREAVLDAIHLHRDARLLVLTSCTYDGFYYDLAPIIEAAHDAGIKVLVDEAWYAHGYFHPSLRPCALEAGADYVTQSTHKTLSAFSQASMIHVRDRAFDEARFREDLNMHTSTSPQYGLLASLDVARKQMSMEGFARLSRCIEHARVLRESIAETQRFRVLRLEDMLPPSLAEDGIRLDPTKLTIAIRGGQGSARRVQRELYERHSIQVEKVTHNTLSLLVTLGSTRGKVLRLVSALKALDEAASSSSPPSRPPLLPMPGRLRLPPRDAYFGATEWISVADDRHGANRDLVGRIAADQIVPYPPGIPVLVPGQEITAEVVDFLLDLTQPGSDAEVHGLRRGDESIDLRVSCLDPAQSAAASGL
jgi:arginine decarboxylase